MSLDRLFRVLLRRHHLPLPVAEYRFAPSQRWRFDYAWLDQKVALEVAGSAWVRGRQTRSNDSEAEGEESRHSSAVGWRLLRVTSDELCTLRTISLVREALGHPRPPS